MSPIQTRPIPIDDANKRAMTEIEYTGDVPLDDSKIARRKQWEERVYGDAE